ncbi:MULTISPECIES: SDR family NAD(P)-dependent oxidoreductase [Noviherbaspirillum]|uniref:SDR family NAD(P)-dependent oxidoreductase n=1 Tax=Noviherbaspirillum TaxID=1344552 RepID=UPI00124CB5BC|nr:MULTISPECIES: SDR family oxidoreductase [Noviherbaspirillum]
MDRQTLDGRVVIVTGGGRGLGRAMTQGLARAGACVVATAARESAELEQVAAEIHAECGDQRVLPVIADVRIAEDCERVVNAALARWQRLDVLVNNAGRGMKYASERFLVEPPRFWEVQPEIWRMVIDTNVNGPFLMARAAVPHLLRAGWGRIVNISMNYETMRRRGFSPYGPSKAALESETIIWAQDLEGTGVTVNALLPGGVTATGMIPPALPDAVRATLLDPQIIVPPLLWLVSADSDGINGRRVLANHWNGSNPAPAIDEAGWTRS